jgi:SpoVK/Ycf46/Vps4 family AAA+-type ATPase
LGKTHIVRTLAQKVGVPFYSIDASNWFILGSGGAERNGETWAHILNFVDNNEAGIIFVDEIDKVGRADQFTYNSWNQHLRVEIYGLLDHRIPSGLSMGSDLTQAEHDQKRAALSSRLRHRMMIVGAGAFQDLWENWAKPSIGLSLNAGSLNREVTNRDIQTVIPPELTNRFAEPIIAMNPLTLEDYRHMLHATAQRLPENMRSRLVETGLKEIGRAVETSLGVRWVEGLLLKILVQHDDGSVKAATRALTSSSC